EFRSSPLDFLSLKLGGAAFYDVGNAYNGAKIFAATHSVGVGLRILFAAYNRDVIRLDLGIPIRGPASGFNNALFTVGFGQAF
ncbi:hypothetical protein JYT19_00770, partial [Sulfobacillus acidophilus]|nr:hypothetical protein [Sulfobacillus acidophilus]